MISFTCPCCHLLAFRMPLPCRHRQGTGLCLRKGKVVGQLHHKQFDAEVDSCWPLRPIQNISMPFSVPHLVSSMSELKGCQHRGLMRLRHFFGAHILDVFAFPLKITPSQLKSKMSSYGRRCASESRCASRSRCASLRGFLRTRGRGC